MDEGTNFFRRAIDAIVEGRMRRAERYVAQFEGERAAKRNKVNGR